MTDSVLGDNIYQNDRRKDLDKKDFETFFRLFYGDLCSFAFKYVTSRDVAKDIVQSVFLKIWEQRSIWEDFESAKGYLYASVRNEALNYRKHEGVKRDAQPEIRLRVAEWQENHYSTTGEYRKLEIIQEGVEQLPGRCREIFKLSREHGLTYKEIAEILDLSIKTVETQIGRALKSLRSFVSEHPDLSVVLIATILSL